MKQTFLHYETNTSAQDSIEVKISRPARVWVMDDLHYSRYSLGKGTNDDTGPGLLEQPQVELKAAYKGKWHVVIDDFEKNKYTDNIQTNVTVIKRA